MPPFFNMFKKIHGQEKAIELLERAITSNRVAQAYLFSGPKGVGKFTTALYFGMALNCLNEVKRRPCGECASCHKFLHFNHLDFLYLFPTPNMDFNEDGSFGNNKFIKEYEEFIENKKNSPWKEFFFSVNSEIRRDAIKVVQYKMSMANHEARYRICIIEDADMMNNNTANAFLKTLEEPPDNTVIILTTTQPERLLPTIISRCQQIKFNPIRRNVIQEYLQKEFGATHNIASSVAKLVNGNLELAINLLENSDSEARDFAWKLVTCCATKDDLAFLHIVNEFRAGRSPKFIVEFISNVSILLNDVIMLRNHPTEIVMPANIELYKLYYKQNQYIDEPLIDYIPILESMSISARGKVNPQLIVSEIYNRICGKLEK